MRLHALAGLPRSGTTLLGNVLSQHPDIHVSGTSALSLCIESVSNVLTNAPEVQADLANVPGSYERYVDAMYAFCAGWYSHRPEEHIIDKGRGWIMYRALLCQLSPEGTVIVCVRDPRDVIASIARQDKKTAVFHSPVARTVYEQADMLMKPDGMVGGPMRFIEDLIRSSADVVFVSYSSFVANPEGTVGRIEKAMGVDSFDHDFGNVANVATDLDALHRLKYIHDGSGPIKATGSDWHDTLDAELDALIAGRYPLYMQTFGYA